MSAPVAKVYVDSIEVGSRFREADPTHVKNLAASIKRIGLLSPITLTEDHHLIAGLHRLRATQSLGFTLIDATVRSVSEMEAEEIEIRENLDRLELSDLDRARALARLQEIHIALHPETAKGGDRKSEQAKNQSAESAVCFAAEVAASTGRSERSIQADLQIAKNLAPDVQDALADTPLAHAKTALLELSREEPEIQREVAKAMAEAGPTSAELRRQKVAEMTEQGLSQATIAKDLGVSQQAVCDDRKVLRGEKPAKPSKPSPKEKQAATAIARDVIEKAKNPPPPPTPIRGNAETIRQLWEQGKPATEIQRLTGLKMETVQKHLQPLLEAARPVYTGPTREEAKQAHPLTEIIDGLERALEVQSWPSVLAQINALKFYRDKEALCA